MRMHWHNRGRRAGCIELANDVMQEHREEEAAQKEPPGAKDCLAG